MTKYQKEVKNWQKLQEEVQKILSGLKVVTCSMKSQFQSLNEDHARFHSYEGPTIFIPTYWKVKGYGHCCPCFAKYAVEEVLSRPKPKKE